MMSLHTVRSKTEQCFDDLFRNIKRDDITQIHECHSAEDDDSTYIFLIWANWTDSTLRAALTENAELNEVELYWLAPGLVAWSEDVC